MSYNDNFFEQIIAAKSALDKLPQLEREIANLKSEVELRDNKIATLSVDIEAKQANADAFKAQTVELGASLDASRKSESDLSSRLSLLVDTLRDLGGNIGAALSVVQPHDEPTPINSLHDIAKDLHAVGAMTSDELKNTGVSVQVDPTPSAPGPTNSTPSGTYYNPQPSSAVEADRIALADAALDFSHVEAPGALLTRKGKHT